MTATTMTTTTTALKRRLTFNTMRDMRVARVWRGVCAEVYRSADSRVDTGLLRRIHHIVASPRVRSIYLSQHTYPPVEPRNTLLSFYSLPSGLSLPIFYYICRNLLCMYVCIYVSIRLECCFSLFVFFVICNSCMLKKKVYFLYIKIIYIERVKEDLWILYFYVEVYIKK